MDEGYVRRDAGPQSGERSYRVGLTRHCISTGLIRLPHALRDVFAEGALVALDVETNAQIQLHARPPRDLAGLTQFFAEHDLRVNDQLELRLSVDGRTLRIAFLRAATRSDVAERVPESEDAPASPADTGDARLVTPPSWREQIVALGQPVATAAAAQEESMEAVGSTVRVRRVGEEQNEVAANDAPQNSAQAFQDPAGQVRSEPHMLVGRVVPSATPEQRFGSDVVERFGSVTVRRLGSDVVAPTPEATLGSPTPAHAARESYADRSMADDGFDASLLERTPAVQVDDAMLGMTAPTPAAKDAPVPVLEDESVHQAWEPQVVHGHAPSEPSWELESADTIDGEDPVHPVQLGLFHAPKRGQEAPQAPRRESSPRRGPHAAGARMSLPAAPVSADDLLDLDVAAVPASSQVGSTLPASQTAEVPAQDDLHARAAAWFADPARPVIVRLDSLRDAFELSDHETLALVDAFVANPPSGVTITPLGPGRVRVGRTTDEGRFG